LNEAAERVAKAATEVGQEVLRWTDGDPVPAPADPCVFLGSLNACAFMPGVLGDPDRLRVSHWLPRVRDIALNATIVPTTVGQLAPLELPWERVFARPDSAMKPFSGRVLETSKLSPAALDHGFYFDDLNLPVVLAEAVEVLEEWRFVAVERQLISHSGYRADGRRAVETEPAEGALNLARDAAQRAPEPTVVIDICRISDADRPFRLVEYNLFSGSDLYACDAEAVVGSIAAAHR